MAINGFLAVNKPVGCTSHDVVHTIRRRFGLKKVGHTGTLDPMATGVLVLCLGTYTRLSQFVTASDKTYRAGIRFGIVTDTQDAEGQIVEQSNWVPDKLEDILPVVKQFEGIIEQVPPMHSAVRVGGKRLYELARKGQEVARESRRVEIHKIEVHNYTPPDLCLSLQCSKGTYVRTLAFDLGTRMGCGAHLFSLCRTAIGHVGLDDCMVLDDALDRPAEVLNAHLLHPRQVLNLPAIRLEANQLKRFYNGNSVDDLNDNLDESLPICVFDDHQTLIGIGRWVLGVLKPVCVIFTPES